MLPLSMSVCVAPLAGSVDRNTADHYNACTAAVAPLAGSVDRNKGGIDLGWLYKTVAPLAGSVDRNLDEMDASIPEVVAPLAGSVDRNATPLYLHQQMKGSLPSRGAWIEIGRC